MEKVNETLGKHTTELALLKQNDEHIKETLEEIKKITKSTNSDMEKLKWKTITISSLCAALVAGIVNLKQFIK